MSLGLGEIGGLMVFALVGVPLAAVLHELTHVAMIYPVAERVEVRWRELAVLCSIEETPETERVARMAGIAPLVIGVCIVIGLVAAGRPLAAPWTPQGMAEWGVWMCYTLTGGKSDYLPAVSEARAAVTE